MCLTSSPILLPSAATLSGSWPDKLSLGVKRCARSRTLENTVHLAHMRPQYLVGPGDPQPVPGPRGCALGSGALGWKAPSARSLVWLETGPCALCAGPRGQASPEADLRLSQWAGEPQL